MAETRTLAWKVVNQTYGAERRSAGSSETGTAKQSEKSQQRQPHLPRSHSARVLTGITA